MISWLSGKLIDSWNNGNRYGIVLANAGVGYEIRILSISKSFIEDKEEISLWVHQVIRDDEYILFGFINKLERNMFRKIIKVNGVGPQIALSLLEEYRPSELTSLIIKEDINKLSKANGVGKRVAQRLIVELKNKLKKIDLGDRLKNTTKPHFENNEAITLEEELRKILIDLDYEVSQIDQVINTILLEQTVDAPKTTSAMPLLNDSTFDAYLKQALLLLSQNVLSKGS